MRGTYDGESGESGDVSASSRVNTCLWLKADMSLPCRLDVGDGIELDLVDLELLELRESRPECFDTLGNR